MSPQLQTQLTAIMGKDAAINPKGEVGLFSLLTFWWIGDVLKTGAKRPLEESDFLALHEDNEAKRLTTKIRTLWEEEKKRCSPGQGTGPKLWKCIMKAVSWGDYAKIIFTGFVDSASRFVFPVLLGLFILELTSRRHDSSRSPLIYIYSTALFVAALSKSLAMHHFSHHSRVLGMRSRAAVTCVIYQQARKLY